jgi:hypothetical protein
MPIAANTSIKLSIYGQKKDAIVGTAGPGTTGFDVSIWAGNNINPQQTQSIVGGFRQLLRHAKANLHNLSGTPAVIHMPIGGGIGDMEINGTPDAGELRLHVGATAYAGGRSHYLDRTFKCLLERWPEESR